MLNSTGPGQIGWAAPELKGSVFGYFLWQGLNGAADVEPSGNRDKVVSLQELLRYLKAYVGQWVTENRADVQEPMLLPADADFPVVFRHSSQPTTVPAPGDADPRWQQIAALWEKHAELRQKAPHRFQPVAWEEFQQKLLRLEQLVEAGEAYEAEFNDTRKQAESLAAAFERDPIGGDVAAYSFPLLRQFGGWPSAAELAAVPAPWKKPPAAAAKPDGEGRNRQSPSRASADKAAEAGASRRPPIRPYSYLAASAAAWEWLLADPSHVGDLPAASEVPRRRRRAARARPDRNPFPADARRASRSAVVEDRPATTSIARSWPGTWPSRPRRRPTTGLSTGSSRRWIGRPIAPRRGGPAVCRLARGPCARPTGFGIGLAGENGRGRRLRARRSIGPAKSPPLSRLRDRAWAEIPYLAQWILARQQNAKSADGQLRLAIEGTRALSLRLDEHLADAAVAAGSGGTRRRASTAPCGHWTGCSRRNAPN